MSKNIIKELVARIEPYEGSISEKIFISTIKGCKTIELKDVYVEKQIQQSLLDLDEERSNVENETIIIKGYFELNVKTLDKNKNKLDFIIKELEEMKKNSLTPKQLEIIVEKIIDDNVNPRLETIETRLETIETRLDTIETCPTIANELKTKNMN